MYVCNRCVCVCVRARARVCVCTRACVRVCVRAYARARVLAVCGFLRFMNSSSVSSYSSLLFRLDSQIVKGCINVLLESRRSVTVGLLANLIIMNKMTRKALKECREMLWRRSLREALCFTILFATEGRVRVYVCVGVCMRACVCLCVCVCVCVCARARVYVKERLRGGGGGERERERERENSVHFL